MGLNPTTALDLANPEHEELHKQHEDLYNENNETIERLAKQYGVAASRDGQVGLVLQHLIEYLIGKEGTIERTEYDIDYEELFQGQLHKIEVDLSGKKFRNGLHVPKPGGLHLP